MDFSESEHSAGGVAKPVATTCIKKCLLCHIPQSDETLEGMIRFVAYPPNHTTDAGVQVLCADAVAPLIISANNMTDYEIISKADLKNKYGTGSDILDALSRCRSLFSRVGNEENECDIEEQEYLLVNEFERHLNMVQYACTQVENQNRKEASKQRVRKASESSQKYELYNQPYKKRAKQNSGNDNILNTSELNDLLCEKNPKENPDTDNANLLNILDRVSSPEHATETQRYESTSGLNNQLCEKISKNNPDTDNVNIPGILDRVLSPETPTQTQRFESVHIRPKNQNRWDKQYMELVSYVERYGHTRVPWKSNEDPTLSYWVDRQRQKYKLYQAGKPSGMTENRIELLNKIGFEWVKNKKWEQSYEDLLSFVRENGHASVPCKFAQNQGLANWVDHQRRIHKHYQRGDPCSLTENRVYLLNKIDFQWDISSRPWKKVYDKLVIFFNENGHTQVPFKFSQNQYLSHWVRNQRSQYKQFLEGDPSSPMTEERIEFLNKINFNWDCTSQPWEDTYGDLATFVKEFGHTRVPRDFTKNPILPQWISIQRTDYRKFHLGNPSNITEDRIELLNKIDFSWDRLSHTWEKSYEELETFVNEFGHTRVPRDFPKNPLLSRWVRDQRLNYKKFHYGDPSNMTEERIELLNKIDFEWTVCPSPRRSSNKIRPYNPDDANENETHTPRNQEKNQEKWDKQYSELESYVERFGNARVPWKFPENPTLSYWVDNQRRSHKKFKSGKSSGMTEVRAELLNKIGFEWDKRKSLNRVSSPGNETQEQEHESFDAASRNQEKNQERWDKHYSELVNYVERFGHARVPWKFPENPALSYWVDNQRRSHKKFESGKPSGMTEARVELMSKLGFEWDKKNSWEKSYEDLVSFVKENGHARVPAKFPLNEGLANWVTIQRGSYKRYLREDLCSITEDRINLLEEIGFEWDLSTHTTKPWEKSYDELVTFVNEFSHTQVPRRFPQNQGLSSWVSDQRSQYKQFLKGDSSTTITEERVELLNKINFKWDCSSQPWEEKYYELATFVKEFGHARVTQEFSEYESLVKWVDKQRQSYKRFHNGDPSSMTEERIELLNKIDFEWVIKKGRPTFSF